MLEIRPILSALTRHKSSTLLIILQIAITFAVVLNSISIINQRLALMDRPSGLAEEQLISLNINAFGENYDVENNIRADVEMLRNTPGVIDAVAINQIPLSGSSDSFRVSSSTKKFDNFEQIGTGFFTSDHHVLDTLGLKLIEGRNFKESDVMYTSSRPAVASVIVTKSLADKVFPDGSALGKQLFYGTTEPSTIIGIVEKMSGGIVHESIFEENLIAPVVSLTKFKRILIRAESQAAVDRLVGEVELMLIKRNPERVVSSVRTLLEVKKDSYSNDVAMTTILWNVIILLLLITALGIVGLVSFNVNQRTKQIGTRRALGAREVDILRYFITENLMITSFGLVIGVFLTMLFNGYLVREFEMTPLNWYLIPAGVLAMFIIGIVSVWMPAQKASKVSPAIATQSV